MIGIDVIGGERRVVIDPATWSLYQALLAETGDGSVRLTYDSGRLELMSPSPRHEKVKTILARLIEAYADSAQIPIEGFGSTTFDREDLQKGLEPDECYYVAHVAAVASKDELDLAIDPPPDLALEIDISPPEVARQPIYAAMGVPEVWRFNGRGVEFLERNESGRYTAIEHSRSFPALSSALINELLTIGMAAGQSGALAELRRRM